MPLHGSHLNGYAFPADDLCVDRRRVNEAKLYGLKRTLPIPAGVLGLDALLVAANRPTGAHLGIALALGVVMITWLVGSWRSVRFTVMHLDDGDAFWEAYVRAARRKTLVVALVVGAASGVGEVVALRYSSWLLAAALLGPVVIALVLLAGLADLRSRRTV